MGSSRRTRSAGNRAARSEQTAAIVLSPAAGPAAAISDLAVLTPSVSQFTGSANAALRLAWRALLAGSLLFVVVAAGGPAVGRWYVEHAVESRPGPVELIDGVMFVQRQGSLDWVAAGPVTALSPGDALRTHEHSRAFVRLFDQSTLLLYPSSTVRVLRAEQGRYRPDRKAAVLFLDSGKVRVGVAPPRDERAEHFFQVRTPHSEIHLEDGSYSIEAVDDETLVVTRRGRATAWAEQEHSSAAPGQRVSVSRGQPPQAAVAAARDLILNGEFLVSQADRALPYRWQHYDASEIEPAGSISINRDAEGGFVRFSRDGVGHGETVLRQDVLRDLSDDERAVLSADVKVDRQSLSGGGWAGTEYPLSLRVYYRDSTRGYTTWYHGFYVQNDDRLPVRDGTQIPAGVWHRQTFDLKKLVPPPVYIVRVEVLGAGWTYDSGVRNVRLVVE